MKPFLGRNFVLQKASQEKLEKEYDG